MLRGDARKRLNPEPLPHHDAAVCDLIAAARADAVAPIAALAGLFDLWARVAGNPAARTSYAACADAVREALGGAA